ncbi:PEP-CTERM sorting domain-containing protein [Glaciimonas sp. GNP009]
MLIISKVEIFKINLFRNNMKKFFGFVAAILLVTPFVHASQISGVDGFGNPVVPGATSTITFDDQSDATFSSLSTGGVTFSGVGGSLRTNNDYHSNYNGRGTRYLDNNAGATSSIKFAFAAPVSAFAFNWGASDDVWTLTAFNSLNAAIESFVLPITHGSNAGDYVGLADADISYATLITSTSYDFIFIDNFTVAAGATNVPEPTSIALLGLGLMGFAAARRKSAKK